MIFNITLFFIMMTFQNKEEELQEIIKMGNLSRNELEFALNNMPCITKTFNLNLYRARVGREFDIIDSSQFTYNHNINNIKKQRYNKDGEAVLYTSTNPSTAFQELKWNCDDGKLYIAVIHPVDKNIVFNCALNINGENLASGSNAYKYYDVAKQKFAGNSEALIFFSHIGEMLEEDKDYNFSSNYASMLFHKYDTFITVSAVSEGSELNVTFNKTAADNKLRLGWVFECKLPKNNNTLCFEVLRIGVCLALKSNGIIGKLFQRVLNVVRP